MAGSGVGIPPSAYQCRPPGGQRERAAGGEPEQPPLGVERVEQPVEVVLVRAAPVDEHERAVRVARGLADERVEAQVCHAALGSGRGVSAGSICSRRCSNAGGSESRSPRWAGSSSVAKPGPIVAISKRTPLGSRK